MTENEVLTLLEAAESRFEQEPNLIELDTGRVIFVGDTHGDVDATRQVMERYLHLGNTIVFLGDYVDRGPASAENLRTLLSAKLEHPDRLFLLMGNHEGQKAMKFHPADFWDSLSAELYERYASALSKLPLAVATSNGVIGLHGALPGVESLAEINEIRFGDKNWAQITWGDWRDESGHYLGQAMMSGRPQFGRDWFEETMAKLGRNVLIRSHQPDAPPILFDDRCLTIFTSHAYRSTVPRRTIAVTDLENPVNTVEDLILETV